MMVDNQLSREDVLEEFLVVLNVCQPEHPHIDDPYPVSEDEVEYTWNRRDSNIWATCGPRPGPIKVKFSADRSYFNRRSAECRLAVLVHEVTHVYHCSSGKGDAGHPPDFWREMAFYALEARDSIDEIRDVMGEVDLEGFLEECVEDPNQSMVDLRRETVEERREEMRDLLGI